MSHERVYAGFIIGNDYVRTFIFLYLRVYLGCQASSHKGVSFGWCIVSRGRGCSFWRVWTFLYTRHLTFNFQGEGRRVRALDFVIRLYFPFALVRTRVVLTLRALFP